MIYLGTSSDKYHDYYYHKGEFVRFIFFSFVSATILDKQENRFINVYERHIFFKRTKTDFEKHILPKKFDFKTGLDDLLLEKILENL